MLLRREPDLARIIACIDASGGIDYTRDRALAESRAAVAALASRADLAPSRRPRRAGGSRSRAGSANPLNAGVTGARRVA